MVTSKQLKEKIRDYRRAFMHNWNLFKDNRVGLLGLAIMVAFIVIALISPFLGLRHPIEWMAPDSDVVVVTEYYNPQTSGAVIHDLAFRMRPEGGSTQRVDRIYYAGGDGTNIAPYGIYARETHGGSNPWKYYDNSDEGLTKSINTHSVVTTKPIGVNFGDMAKSAGLEFWVFFGTEDGTLYSVRDGLNNIYVPSYTDNETWEDSDMDNGRLNRWSLPLNGTISGINVFKDDETHSYKIINHHDMVFVTTVNGYIYGFTGHRGPVWDAYLNDNVTAFKGWNLTWQNHIPNATLTSPAIDGDGKYVYVGTRDGKLHGFEIPAMSDSGLTPIDDGVYDLYDPMYDYTEDGIQSAEKADANLRRNYWSKNPVGMLNKIFASTDDGRLHIIHANNATPLIGWEGGYQLNLTAIDLDLGNLTAPDVSNDANEARVGSSTGYVYRLTAAIITDESPVKQIFDTSLNSALDTTCVAPPYQDWQYTRYVFVAARNMNFTDDPSDDTTILFCINTESQSSSEGGEDGADEGSSSVGGGYIGAANITWRQTLEGVAFAQPIVYDDYATNDQQEHISTAEIAIATVKLDSNGNPDTNTTGKIYALEAGGKMITPLPPTWSMSDEWKEEQGWDLAELKEPGMTPSGNRYTMGTDAQGRDVLSQTLLGSRIALLVGFAAAIFSISIGLLVGLVSGYYGGNVDTILMRFTDVILTLPGLPLLIILAAVMEPSIWNIVFIIGIVGWGGVARVIRSEVLTLKERPFIDSARVTGASKARIMFRHIAPNILPLGVLYMTFYVSGAILSEASLSFIGLGDPRTMSWGMMLNFVQHANALTAWWWLLPPGICITLICLSFFLLGRAFDEIVNPRLRRRR